MAEFLSDVTYKLETTRRLKTIENDLKGLAIRARPADHLFRALAVMIVHDSKEKSQGRELNILDTIRSCYGENENVRTVIARMITKAAVIPADTTTSGWADVLVQTVIGDFIDSLMPISVYAQLAGLGGSFTFGRNGAVILPARNTTASVAGAFVAQGAPIPVKQGAFAPITLTPKKMAVITALTREITEHSTPSIEAIVRTAIMEDTSVAIDSILLDANPATLVRPAGLKNGVTKTGPTAGGAVAAAVIGDIRALATSLITGAKGNLRAPVWIMNPLDVLAMAMIPATSGEMPFRSTVTGHELIGYPIIQSTNVAVDSMFLIDAADFIAASDDTPTFSVSDQATIHMEDTTPLAIGTPGSPPTVAAPVRSLFQTDSLAIRMILPMNWTMRRTGVVSWTDTMTWNP